MFSTATIISSAQTILTNPFGLVYQDAITENISGKVNIHPVTYKLNGIDIAANIYTPANYDPSKTYPAVVVAHPNGGVNADQLGLLGVCGGGGYSLKAAQTNKRFKAVATLSMFNSGVVRRNGFRNSGLATIQERLKQASEARALEAAGVKCFMLPIQNGTPVSKPDPKKTRLDVIEKAVTSGNLQ